jgi:hypothetical protein
MLIVGGWFTLPGHLFLWLTLILSLVSGGQYFYFYRHHLVRSGSTPTDG